VTAWADLSRGLGNDAVACPVLGQREQDGAAGLADHGIGLPVSGAGAFLNDPRPLVAGRCSRILLQQLCS